MSDNLTRDPRKRIVNYPSPWFDIGQTWLPSTVKDLFRWCKYYFYSNPLINAVITKISEYPVTDIIYEFSERAMDKKGTYTDTQKRLKQVFEVVLNIKSFLIESHIDYFTYGNALVSLYMPFKRFLVCTECNNEVPIDSVQFQFKQFNFLFECSKCNTLRNGTVKDVTVPTTEGLNLVRWNPENITIDYNPITGKSYYYYRIPVKIKNDIIRGKRVTLEEIPRIFIEAVKQKKDLLLSNDNLFHFKRPTLAEEDMGWGKPILMHVLKDVFYLQTLRRAQEAIAMQHIVPLDVLSPRAASAVDPYTHLDLARWKGEIIKEIEKWKRDPNYISIMPIPLEISRYGGDAKVLLITPEVQMMNQVICGGLGVPIEFIMGGLSWSGSSVSLRTLENHFLTTRENDHRFLIWLVDKVKNALKLPEDLRLRMADFKMADDIQQKQLVLNMNAAQKVSDQTLLSEFGFEPTVENARIEEQVRRAGDIQTLMAKTQATANGEAQEIQMQYQLKVQDMQQKVMEQQQKKQGVPGGPMIDPTMQGAPALPGVAAPPGAAAPDGAPVDWNMQVKTIVNQLDGMDDASRQKSLDKIQKEYPPLFDMIKEYKETGGIQRGRQVDMRPLPEQKPPRRQGAAI